MQTQIQPLQREVDLAMLRSARSPSRPTWAGRPTTSAPCSTRGNPENLAQQLTFIDMLARAGANSVSAGGRDEGHLRRAEGADRRPRSASCPSRTPTWPPAGAPSRPSCLTCRNSASRRYGAGGGAQGKYRPWTCPAEYLPTNGYKAAEVRLRPGRQTVRVGAPAGPSSYDCSGLVLAGWKQVGVYLPHNAAAQRRSDAVRQPGRHPDR